MVNRLMFVKHYAPVATKAKKAIFAQRSLFFRM